jgi:hypothetical protein
MKTEPNANVAYDLLATIASYCTKYLIDRNPSDEVRSTKEPFCVELTKATFHLFFSLLMDMSNHIQKPKDSNDHLSAVYCLKLLRTNLQYVVRHNFSLLELDLESPRMYIFVAGSN